ncbi:MAG: 3-phosphoshikimate 1-carboxyvinyltransferase [Spirochaetaceae bacterium]|nr:3-phosphoshikimate 1-carboxyvinyltransferase [Spirochaetaceae bacterium]
MTKFVEPGSVGGALAAPASKSATQRAVACALLAAGKSRLLGPGRSDDCLAALGVAAALGAGVEDDGASWSIRGVGAASPGPLAAASAAKPFAPAPTRPPAENEPAGSGPDRELRCGESGLALRMFSPIAALFPGETRLLASGSLRNRPVSMLEAPLRALGAACSTEGGLPPVTVRGPLSGGRAAVDGGESSQFLTGLLVALPLAEGDSLLEVERLASAGYVDLTIDTMRAFGVEVDVEPAGEGRRYRVRGRQAYAARDFRIEGDWSGAAFPLVAAAIAGRAEGLLVGNLGADSLQPDRGVVEALVSAGAAVEWAGDGLRVRPAPLRAFRFDARQRPDLFPPLAVLAAAAEGESRILGAGRLRAKESDRAASVTDCLRALGVEAWVEGDEMRIRGVGPAGRFSGGRVDARGDHRIAMAAAVAALAAEAPVEILGAECVAKSWPAFYEDLAAVVGR